MSQVKIRCANGWCEAHFIFSTPYYAVPHKNISKKLKLRLKNILIDKMLSYASETWILTKRDRKQMNIFERKVYRRILDPVHDNEKENCRIFTTTEIYATVKKPTRSVHANGMNEWMNIKFSHLGDQVPWISAPLTYSILINKKSLPFQVHTIHTTASTS